MGFFVCMLLDANLPGNVLRIGTDIVHSCAENALSSAWTLGDTTSGRSGIKEPKCWWKGPEF